MTDPDDIFRRVDEDEALEIYGPWFGKVDYVEEQYCDED